MNINSRILSFLIVLFLAFNLSSCVRMREFPISGEFDGIKTALDRQSSVSVLIIHGLGGYSEGDPDVLIQSITQGLNLYDSSPTCIREITACSCGYQKMYGYLKKQEYQGLCSPYFLCIYSLDWRGATWQEKSQLRQIDERFAHYRLSSTNELKQGVIDNGLADAILYASNYRKEIQYPFIQAMRWIQEDTKNEPEHEIIVVGFSLGSSIIIDTLDAMQSLPDQGEENLLAKDTAERFIQQLTAFFMLSNTSPIFELAELVPPQTNYSYLDSKACSLDREPDYATMANRIPIRNYALNWRSTALGRFIEEKRQFIPDFQIVSISDPNDPLSYIVDDYYVPSDSIRRNAFINERVRNVKWSLFGFVNPIKAHTGYGRNKDVLNMIIFGARRSYCMCLDESNFNQVN